MFPNCFSVRPLWFANSLQWISSHSRIMKLDAPERWEPEIGMGAENFGAPLGSWCSGWLPTNLCFEQTCANLCNEDRKISKSYCYGAIWDPKTGACANLCNEGPENDQENIKILLLWCDLGSQNRAVCIFVLVDILWDPKISKPRRSAALELPQKWSANSVTRTHTYAKSWQVRIWGSPFGVVPFVNSVHS